jgi:Zn-dependent peptidase ImmA (M78 family)
LQLPTEIEIVGKIKLKVIETETKLIKKHLGQWDPKAETIYIHKNQTLYSKWVTLFHEVLHAIDDELIYAGEKKIAYSENSIEFAASSIFGFLAINKLIPNLISQKELQEDVPFLENKIRDQNNI